MPSSCKDIRAALADCLSTSPCVLSGTPASECLREPLASELPTRCQQLKKGYGDCKRGMIDMRKRFRGNKPIGSTSDTPDSEDEGSRYVNGMEGGMLYAGIGKKDGGEGSRVAGDVGYGRAEDERRAREELIPGRFKDESGGVASYLPPADFVPRSEVKGERTSAVEREGGGWTWWR